MFKLSKKFKKGFTLVELMVVISLIGMMSTIVLASLSTARAKSRDTQRTLAIKQVQNALEIYFSTNDQYPSSGDVAFPGVLTVALTPAYISAIPVNSNASNPYRYFTNSMSPAPFYAIYVPYEAKNACYVCGGPRSYCAPGLAYWSVPMC